MPLPFRRAGVRLFVAAFLWSGATARAQVPAQAEVVTGRVLTEAAVPVADAEVYVTPAGTTATTVTKTDKAGVFSATFDHPAPEYLVVVNAVGFAQARARGRRTDGVSGDTPIRIEIRLAPKVAELSAVRIEVLRRPRPGRSSSGPLGVGQMAAPLDGFPLVDGIEMGAFANALGSMPGVTTLGTGFSVFGMGTDQNSLTIGGMTFTGTTLPRDAVASMSVVTATGDASRSGFSGGLASIRVLPAGSHDASLHVTVDRRDLQWNGRHPSAASPFSNTIASGMLTDVLPHDAGSYTLYWQAGRRSVPTPTLFDASPAALRSFGIAADSAQRVVLAAGAAGLPLGDDARSVQTATTASLFGTIYARSEGDRSFSTDVSANWSRRDGTGLGLLSAQSLGTGNSATSLWLSSSFGTYIGSAILSTTRVAVGSDMNQGTSATIGPAALVQVASDVGDASPAFATVALGGNPSPASHTHDWNAQLRQELTWYTTDGYHRLMATGYARLDGYNTSTPGDAGTFAYTSIDALARNLPATFTRSFGSTASRGNEVTANVSLTDAWKPRTTFHATFGVNVEGTRFLRSPARNPTVESVFGRRTDVAPASVSVSPRLALTWDIGRLPLALQSWSEPEPLGQLNASFGEYRATLGPHLLETASIATGLPGNLLDLVCVGDAVPVPDWSRYVSGGLPPTECLFGDGPVARRAAAPSVVLFDPGYGPSRSRRATIGWRERLDPATVATLGFWYTNTMNMASRTDLNLSTAHGFSLADEGNRRVYIPAADIDPASGAMTTRDSRIDPAFGRVTERRSDLRAHSAQFQAAVTRARYGDPEIPGYPRRAATLSYTYLIGRQQQRGFGGTTDGDPNRVEWSPSAIDDQHQIKLTVNWAFGGIGVQADARVMSGLRYTPVVAGDVNGDGSSNDRAFVFDPYAGRTLPELAAAMTSLLEQAPAGASSCLERALGKIASANSCRGPLSTTLNLRASFGAVRRRTLDRFHPALVLTNVPAALDALLHGGDGTRGWGQGAFPDPVLLRVRGFDPANARFLYDVNPKFGRTVPSVWARPRLTLDVSVDLADSQDKQSVEGIIREPRWGGPRTAPRRTEAQILESLVGTTVGGIGWIMNRADSLGVSRDQRELLKGIETFTLTRDRLIFGPLAKRLAALGADYDANAVMREIVAAYAQSAENLSDGVGRAREVLTEEQLQRLPSFIQFQFDPEKARRQRRRK